MSQHDNKNEKPKANLTLSSPFSFVTSRFKSHASTTVHPFLKGVKLRHELTLYMMNKFEKKSQREILTVYNPHESTPS